MKQLLLYRCLPRRMIGLIAGVQVPVIPASTPGAFGRRLSESIPCSRPWTPEMWPVFPLGNGAGMTLA